jgi:hypothetical protein
MACNKLYKAQYCRFALLNILVVLAGCSINTPLPEVDLSAPGWKVWSGQALWKPQSNQPAIAGEVVLARNNNGDVFISFVKPPLSVFNAQTFGNRWNIDFIYKQRTHSGSDGPPSYFVWFQIPALLQGAPAAKGWQVKGMHNTTWELHNPDSGEQIRLELDK